MKKTNSCAPCAQAKKKAFGLALIMGALLSVSACTKELPPTTAASASPTPDPNKVEVTCGGKKVFVEKAIARFDPVTGQINVGLTCSNEADSLKGIIPSVIVLPNGSTISGIGSNNAPNGTVINGTGITNPSPSPTVSVLPNLLAQNIAPNPGTISFDGSVKVGNPIPIGFSAVDPNGDSMTYSVDYGDGKGVVEQAGNASGNKFSRSITYESPGTKTITAYAKDSFGAQSGVATRTLEVSGEFRPADILNVRLTNQNTSVLIEWDAAQYAAFYRIERKEDATQIVKLFDATTNVFTDTDVQPGLKYIYTVTGVNKFGDRGPGLQKSVTTGDLPMMTGVQVYLADAGKVTTAWARAGNIAGVRIFKYDKTNNTTEQIDITDPTVSSYTFSAESIRTNINYEFNIVARNTRGDLGAPLGANIPLNRGAPPAILIDTAVLSANEAGYTGAVRVLYPPNPIVAFAIAVYRLFRLDDINKSSNWKQVIQYDKYPTQNYDDTTIDKSNQAYYYFVQTCTTDGFCTSLPNTTNPATLEAIAGVKKAISGPIKLFPGMASVDSVTGIDRTTVELTIGTVTDGETYDILYKPAVNQSEDNYMLLLARVAPPGDLPTPGRFKVQATVQTGVYRFKVQANNKRGPGPLSNSTLGATVCGDPAQAQAQGCVAPAPVVTPTPVITPNPVVTPTPVTTPFPVQTLPPVSNRAITASGGNLRFSLGFQGTVVGDNFGALPGETIDLGQVTSIVYGNNRTGWFPTSPNPIRCNAIFGATTEISCSGVRAGDQGNLRFQYANGTVKWFDIRDFEVFTSLSGVTITTDPADSAKRQLRADVN